ncbi:uncharacterized protein EAE98_011867 [Botrytis deweyae]|uniref:Uncharacterized protein n=2 Tax=Botrytis TaxID=33196 RepID=A0A4Z1JU64_9HELO|nr:uncharacterized protein EAE98_011867 [Botrytis deweyae]KAF7911752.1 hypothetical protein EAE98_011867 [Botrytis deweyae]KAF7915261.1 hypothetical protein EAE99_010253 [Botrytis elliptica]TGO72763.1 hypothetical protein BELL_0421g00110 [Botrytis elliptica]
MLVEVPVKVSKPRCARITNIYKGVIEGKLLSLDPPNSAETGLRSSEYPTTLSIIEDLSRRNI